MQGKGLPKSLVDAVKTGTGSKWPDVGTGQQTADALVAASTWAGNVVDLFGLWFERRQLHDKRYGTRMQSYRTRGLELGTGKKYNSLPPRRQPKDRG